MADKSTKTMATIPDRYSPDFAERLDKRTSIAKAIIERIETIETDMGGAEALSHARRSLIRRTVWLEAIIEHTEQRLAAGEGIDLGGHTQAINSLLGLYRLLGLERRARPTETLESLMYRAEPGPRPAPDRGGTAAAGGRQDEPGEPDADEEEELEAQDLAAEEAAL
jgi:hypothetical protein